MLILTLKYTQTKKIYVDSINVNKGQYFFEKPLKLKSEKLTDNITLDILTESFNDYKPTQ